MAVFGLGQPVVVVREAQAAVGIVAGMLQSPLGVLYDVEVSQSIHKGLLDEELLPATSADVQRELEALLSPAVMPRPTVSLTSVLPPTREDERLQYVRSRFALRLQEALSAATDGDGTCEEARFGMGSQVAWHDGDAWRLARVLGIRTLAAGLRYELDVCGACALASEQELSRVDELPVAPIHGLGSRVRFLVPGHELDVDYEATVCAVVGDAAGATYDIVFNDGDVFEGLSADELLPV